MHVFSCLLLVHALRATAFENAGHHLKKDVGVEQMNVSETLDPDVVARVRAMQERRQARREAAEALEKELTQFRAPLQEARKAAAVQARLVRQAEEEGDSLKLEGERQKYIAANEKAYDLYRKFEALREHGLDGELLLTRTEKDLSQVDKQFAAAVDAVQLQETKVQEAKDPMMVEEAQGNLDTANQRARELHLKIATLQSQILAESLEAELDGAKAVLFSQEKKVMAAAARVEEEKKKVAEANARAFELRWKFQVVSEGALPNPTQAEQELTEVQAEHEEASKAVARQEQKLQGAPSEIREQEQLNLVAQRQQMYELSMRVSDLQGRILKGEERRSDVSQDRSSASLASVIVAVLSVAAL